MPNYKDQISDLLGSTPEDLVHYYESGVQPSFPKSRINCLPFETALRYSQQLHSISIAKRLGLWTLDDANDSNPFCYISRGPCKGTIIRFSHDPEPEIYFSSLRHFCESIITLGTIGKDIDELQKEVGLSFSLENEIRALCSENSDDAIFLITTYLSVCSNLSPSTKSSLLAHNDFFVREALAMFLIANPTVLDLTLADDLAKDKHPQVAKPGSIARSTINKIKWRS